MSRRKSIPLTFEDQQHRTAEAAAKRKADRLAAEDRERKAEAEKARKRADNATLKVQGAKIHADAMGNMIAGRRFYCFDLLLKDQPHAHKAVAWLEDILRTAEGENTQDRRPDHIRASTVGAPGQNITDRQIEAGEVLATIEEGMRPDQLRMILALLKPDQALYTRWHGVVQAMTGEVNAQAQGARVRDACESLAWVRVNIDTLAASRKRRKEAQRQMDEAA